MLATVNQKSDNVYNALKYILNNVNYYIQKYIVDPVNFIYILNIVKIGFINSKSNVITITIPYSILPEEVLGYLKSTYPELLI